MHMAIITGRNESIYNDTVNELHKIGILGWDLLVLRPSNQRSLQVYKTNARMKIQYDYCQGQSCILVNIGDQETDLRGGYSQYIFKLPSFY